MKRLFLTALVVTIGLSACGDSRDQAVADAPAAVPMKPAWPPIEEGQRLAANPLTRNYYIVFDASGSMADNRCADGESSKMEAARKAIIAFADSLPADANLGMLSFDDVGIQEHIALAPVDEARFREVVERINTGGTTPLRSAMDTAYQAITEQAKQQLGYGEYHLVVVTDGEFNPKSEDPSDVVEHILADTPIVIHTIGFCVGTEHSLNQRGRTFYKTANNPEELKQGLDQVLAESPSFDVNKFQ